MKTISFVLLCAIVSVIASCKDGTASSAANTLQYIYEYRTIQIDGAEVELYPFILFNKVRFDSLDYGIGTSAIFTILDPTQKLKVLQSDNPTTMGNEITVTSPFQTLRIEIDDLNATPSFIAKLELLEGKLTRKVNAGETYNLLYYYEVDHRVHRDNVPTEYRSGFRLLDIVPEGQKFRNQEMLY